MIPVFKIVLIVLIIKSSVYNMKGLHMTKKVLLRQEIQSLHWTQNQCTVYPVVALRKVNDKIKEDHFVVISGDIKHDVKFAEFANITIDENYTQKGIVFENEIEFNDGCSSQYKSTFA